MRERREDWNFIANVMDGGLFSLAMSLVSQQTILPLFVQRIGGGNVAVGLIPVLWILGFNFPQILAAPYAQRHLRKKPMLLKTAMLQRIPWLLLAAASATLPWGPEGVAVAAFLLLWGLAAVGGSVNLPVWFDLVAKLTPVKRRGRLFGARSILGSFLGIGGGAAATLVLARVGFPENFALLFLLAFLVMMVSYLFLISLRETADSVPGRPVITGELLRSVPSILRSHEQFRRFLVADALLVSATMATAFYAVHGIRKFHLPDAAAGEYTMVMMAGGITGSLLFGPLADRFGHRLNLLCGSGAVILACVIAIAAPTPLVHGAVFVFSALALSLGMISRLPFLAEIVPEAERPSMVALANMLTSPFALWGAAAGHIADTWGTVAVFALAGTFALAALLWTLGKIREPRHISSR